METKYKIDKTETPAEMGTGQYQDLTYLKRIFSRRKSAFFKEINVRKDYSDQWNEKIEEWLLKHFNTKEIKFNYWTNHKIKKRALQEILKLGGVCLLVKKPNKKYGQWIVYFGMRK